MTEYDEMYGSKFLGAHDADEAEDGKIRARIKSVDIETFTDMKTQRTEKKYVLTLSGQTKRLRLGKINAGAIAKAVGTDKSRWLNLAIELTPIETQMGPGLSLRVLPAPKPTATQQPKPKPPIEDDMADEIPDFDER